MNCIIVDDEAFSRSVVKTFVDRTDNLNLVGEFDNAIEAFKLLQKTSIDIIFLDVEMPEMSGIELVKSLETLPQVILITSREQYAVEAFEYNVTDYLIKPAEYPRFLKAIKKAEDNMNKAVMDALNKDDIYVKADNKIVKIQLSNILFVEALSDYVIINTPEKRYIVHSTMKGLLARLPESNFIRVHRSYIVNIDQIQSIEDSGIVMPKKNIPIGASYKSKFMERLNFL